MVTSSSTVFTGTPVVPGIAFAAAVVMRSQIAPSAVAAFRSCAFADAAAALEAYDAAAAAVADGYQQRAAGAHGAAAQVLTASAGLASDSGLRSTVRSALRGGLHGGGDLLDAVEAAVEQFVGVFTGMGGLMAERATDLRDIERRLLARLVGEPEPGAPQPQQPSVLVAEDLAPSDTAGLDPRWVVALVTERGGPTSHTAIIARQLGIPCVVGMTGVMTVANGAPLLVDARAGTATLGADPGAARTLVEDDRARTEELARWTGPGATADGRRVKLLANVTDGGSARSASGSPVEGVGLFRTELCFLNRTEEPTVAEQAQIYAEVLSAFRGSCVVVRTLDAGSDKPVAFATREDEENPALGVRGLRLCLDHPGLLERQLDAIAEAAGSTGTETWVMAPMVATVAEAAGFAAQVRGRGLRAGVMVEVPSAALLADQVLATVDFLSVGTNDLTQYTMAADRMATDLAHLTDPWQPAVLRLIEMTARAGREAGKPVGVCGEAAADPVLACALVGMGITSLSMAAAAVRPVGASLARVSHSLCEDIAKAVLACDDPRSARAVAQALLEA